MKPTLWPLPPLRLTLDQRRSSPRYPLTYSFTLYTILSLNARNLSRAPWSDNDERCTGLPWSSDASVDPSTLVCRRYKSQAMSNGADHATACMHILRSSYLPAYSELVKYPYTSDPFPLAATPAADASSLASAPVLPSLQRETAVLDLFIALKVREDVWVDDSELHLERDESFRDLFDLLQPRARLEDLIRIYGQRNGLVFSKLDRSDGPKSRKGMLDFATLAVSFSSRRVGIIVTSNGRKRTIVETERARDEALEAAAQRLILDMGDWLHT